ncbi:MAG: imidazoleglycerol-phosphate dehydratase HisB [Clostridia bacterium]|nr:imidazoleglycerol-phosphate dehydratase HisB [Clostridia bacterium]
MNRTAQHQRVTSETKINIGLELDGQGKMEGTTGIAFMDHMLDLWSHHSGCDLFIDAQGDLEVDYHHTVEDLGICLGHCINAALGDRSGIQRYAHTIIPMDESLVMVVLDFSGRPYLNYDVSFKTEKVGAFDVELAEEFFRATANHGRLTLHIKLLEGRNSHHILEAMFKAFAGAVKQGVALVGKGIPSTKGLL